MGRYLLAVAMVLTLAGTLYAAPVGLTSEADTAKGELWADKDLGVTLGIVTDIVSERKIDIDSGTFEMNAVMARLGLSVLNKINFYVDLGQAINMEYAYVILGEKYTTKFEDGFLWGVGVSGLIYRWSNGLEIGANASYRSAEMNIETSTIGGTEYKTSQMTSKADGDFEEIQGALEVAWKTNYLTPYIGVKFSDVDVDANFTVGGSARNASGKNSASNIGAFVGLTLTPRLEESPKSEQVIINVEARFIDEEAVSIAASYRF